MLLMAVVLFLWNTSGIKFMDITKTSQSLILDSLSIGM